MLTAAVTLIAAPHADAAALFSWQEPDPSYYRPVPTAHAVKMWNWTRMGARVVITPGQITPANFSHPLLVAQKVVPQPLIANDPATDAPAVKSDKGADAGAETKPADASLAHSETSL